MIASHGMAANYKTVESVQTNKTKVGFNFNDYDCFAKGTDFANTHFGTPEEIIPLLLVMQKYVVKKGHENIDLYGFSAGGGAIINAIGALNTNRFDPLLAKWGITAQDKQKMLQAVRKGVIILDVPLKSMREIIAFRGQNRDLHLLEKRYRTNDMEPIDALKYLQGLTLHVIVHFQIPDEALSNRDDLLFYTRLKQYNPQGHNDLVLGNDGGHTSYHASLWDFYR